jgi:hypothetical protein
MTGERNNTPSIYQQPCQADQTSCIAVSVHGNTCVHPPPGHGSMQLGAQQEKPVRRTGYTLLTCPHHRIACHATIPIDPPKRPIRSSPQITRSVKRPRYILPVAPVDTIPGATAADMEQPSSPNKTYLAEAGMNSARSVRNLLLNQGAPCLAHILFLRKMVPRRVRRQRWWWEWELECWIPEHPEPPEPDLGEYLHRSAARYCSWWLPELMQALCPRTRTRILSACTPMVRGDLHCFGQGGWVGQIRTRPETIDELTHLTQGLLPAADDVILRRMLHTTPPEETDPSTSWNAAQRTLLRNLVHDVVAAEDWTLLAHHCPALYAKHRSKIQQGYIAYQAKKHLLTGVVDYSIMHGLSLPLRGTVGPMMVLLGRSGDEITSKSTHAMFHDKIRISPLDPPFNMDPRLMAYPCGYENQGMLIDTSHVPRQMLVTTIRDSLGCPTVLALVVADYVPPDCTEEAGEDDLE